MILLTLLIFTVVTDVITAAFIIIITVNAASVLVVGTWAVIEDTVFTLVLFLSAMLMALLMLSFLSLLLLLLLTIVFIGHIDDTPDVVISIAVVTFSVNYFDSSSYCPIFLFGLLLLLFLLLPLF